ncbi:hypothetical protein KJ708_03430 [bacterium]|nr:hypothetical protein [bacterium]MBU1916478.1 hypothetical protein [bacterium]
MKRVIPESIDQMTDIIDIEGIVHSPWLSFLKTALVIAVLLFVVALVSYIIWKIVKKIKAKKEALYISPDEEALSGLSRIKNKKYLEQNQWQYYYFDLDEVLRRYIFRRFHVDVLDKTFEEIRFIEKKNVHLKSFRDFWSRAQMIKFAKRPSTPDDCEKDFKVVRDFVLRTKELDKREEPISIANNQ